MGNRTVLKKGKPRFAIRETAYARASATRGFIEPIFIVGIDFEPGRADYLYTWQNGNGPGSKISPVQLYESELIVLCEALDIQISVLNRELSEQQVRLQSICPNGPIVAPTQIPSIDGDQITPPAPRFGVNDVVYLLESAEVVGRLEAFRINDISWDNSFRQWKYIMIVKPRPGKTMTIGDRGDMTHNLSIGYPESQLGAVCEALPLAVKFLQRALNKAVTRRSTFCPGSSEV